MGRRVLSDAEVDAFHRDGQLTPSFRPVNDLVARMHSAIEGLIAHNPDIRPEQLVGAHVKESKDTGVKGAEDLLECARHPDILDPVEQLIGRDIIFWGSQVFSKPAGDGMAIPWHQDGQYWPMRPLKSVTVWVAIDPARAENGCMRVIPGTHRNGLMEHESSADDTLALNQGLKKEVFDEDQAYDVELEPGQFSLHDAMVIHGSNANRSGMRRCGYAMRFMPATSLFDRSIPPTRIAHNQVIDFSQRLIWLVRGEDQAGNDFSVGR